MDSYNSDDLDGLSVEDRRQQWLDQAREGLAAAGEQSVCVGISPGEAHITDRDRYCPAAAPCPGRPAVGIAVPVRLKSTRARVGEVTGVYCPRCRGWAADGRR